LKRTLKHKRILLTGGNSGLGWSMLQLILPLAKEIIVLDLKVDRLKALKSTCNSKLFYYEFDLSRSFTSSDLDDIFINHHIDIVIHNAGITLIKPFLESEELDFKRVMDVNFYAPVTISKYLLNKDLKEMIVINSLAGIVPLYARSAYVASKHALAGFVKTITIECDLDVLSVYPSFINTGIRVNAQSGGKKNIRIKNKSIMSPDTVAKDIIVAWEKGKNHLYVGIQAKLGVLLYRLFPKVFNYFMLLKNKKI
jgi:dehydrogenase/reductase SDR family member 7B